MNKFILGIKIQRSADAEVLAFSIVDVCSVSVGALSVEVVGPCSEEFDHNYPDPNDVKGGIAPIFTVFIQAVSSVPTGLRIVRFTICIIAEASANHEAGKGEVEECG